MKSFDGVKYFWGKNEPFRSSAAPEKNSLSILVMSVTTASKAFWSLCFEKVLKGRKKKFPSLFYVLQECQSPHFCSSLSFHCASNCFGFFCSSLFVLLFSMFSSSLFFTQHKYLWVKRYTNSLGYLDNELLGLELAVLTRDCSVERINWNIILAGRHASSTKRNS